jgi:hypothetical protein
LSGSASYTFTVIAPFTITATPAQESVLAGLLGGVTLQIASQDSFAGNVKLTCSGAPGGSICLDLPMSVILPANGQALAISGVIFPVTTPPGTYTITYTATSGADTASTTVTFKVSGL